MKRYTKEEHRALRQAHAHDTPSPTGVEANAVSPAAAELTPPLGLGGKGTARHLIAEVEAEKRDQHLTEDLHADLELDQRQRSDTAPLRPPPAAFDPAASNRASRERRARRAATDENIDLVTGDMTLTELRRPPPPKCEADPSGLLHSALTFEQVCAELQREDEQRAAATMTEILDAHLKPRDALATPLADVPIEQIRRDVRDKHDRTDWDAIDRQMAAMVATPLNSPSHTPYGARVAAHLKTHYSTDYRTRDDGLVREPDGTKRLKTVEERIQYAAQADAEAADAAELEGIKRGVDKRITQARRRSQIPRYVYGSGVTVAYAILSAGFVYASWVLWGHQERAVSALTIIGALTFAGAAAAAYVEAFRRT